jgi:hypothetical protein
MIRPVTRPNNHASPSSIYIACIRLKKPALASVPTPGGGECYAASANKP